MIVLVSAYKFKEAQTLLSMVKLSLEMSLEAIGTNVLHIGDVAGLGALKFHFTTNFFSSTNVQITTEPAISANVLLLAGFLSGCP